MIFLENYMDCGIEIYGEEQNVQSGGSGCGCSAVMLTGFILKKLESGDWKECYLYQQELFCHK